MANEKRLIDVSQESINAVLEKVPYYPDEIWKFTAMTERFPTVDAVEVVHGRWDDGECTACGFDIRDMIDGESDFRNWVWDGVPYCPNCGAKMDGDGND